MRKIADADRTAPGLVLIRRPDAAAGRADLAGAAGVLAQAIEVAVERQDQRAGIGDPQRLGGRDDALRTQPRDFVLQRPRIEHHAVADEGRRPADDARRQQRQIVHVLADDQRVAGVMPALEPHDHVGTLGEPVDDLALAFVAPLRADDCYVGQTLSPEDYAQRLQRAGLARHP